jgi:SAM-dependent methyltransferase
MSAIDYRLGRAMADPGLAGYYDRLARWNDVARAIGYDGGARALTVHRMLADPQAGGRPTSTRLHDVLCDALPPTLEPRVLDAGCGLGGTMIDLARRRGGRYLGVTLSATQAAVAARAIVGAGLAGSVAVRVGTYDDPPSGPFDWVIAIESLAHSAEPNASLAALAGVLAPGGVVAVVDDMPEPEASGSSDLAAFKMGWRCPVLWGRGDYVRAAERLGLRLVFERDLSVDCRPRPAWRVRWLLALNRVARRLVPWSGLRAVMDSHAGGLALERLIRAGSVHYRLLILGSRH